MSSKTVYLLSSHLKPSHLSLVIDYTFYLYPMSTDTSLFQRYIIRML